MVDDGVGIVDQADGASVVPALSAAVGIVAVVGGFDRVVSKKRIVGDGRRRLVAVNARAVALDPSAGDDKAVDGRLIGADQNAVLFATVEDGLVEVNIAFPGFGIETAVEVDAGRQGNGVVRYSAPSATRIASAPDSVPRATA